MEAARMTSTQTPQARLSTADLPAVDPSIPPWPGERARVGGAEVFIRRTPGPAEGGEPALYVHGLGGASTNWTDFAALLATRLDAESPDLPGFGWSDPPPVTAGRRAYSITAQADLVIALLARRRGPVHLVGNSMGGAISIQVAARRPDLVRTLTLISPAVPDLTPRRGSDPALPLLLVPGVDRLVARRLGRLSPARRTQALLDLVYGDPSIVPANRRAEAEAEFARRAGLAHSTEALARAFRGLVGAYLLPGERSMWRLAARITAPTLVVWGDRDRLVHVSNAPRTARTIPGARLLVLPGIGHVAQLEAPETTARAVLGLIEDNA
jgi:pimeloyl-ACP methyl ester carboxylesterase